MRQWRLLAMGMVMVAGCHRGSPLTGSWEGTTNWRTSGHQITFTSDGKFRMTDSADPSATVDVTANSSGTWRLEGNKLYLLCSEVNWKFTGTDPEKVAKSQARYEQLKDTILKNSKNMPPMTISWNGPDEFSFSPSQAIVVTYHRMK